MTNEIVRLEGVEKVYRTGDTTITALSSTTIEVQANKLTLVMGPSGSGKTTLLSIIGCVIYPDVGDVFYKGERVSALPEMKLADIRLKEIGFVFQHFNLIEPLNALENVMQPLLLQGYSIKDAKKKAHKALSAVRLEDRIGNLPKKLSGGQKQRVAIARALVNNPSMILCDEPTASLDAKSAKIVMEELKSLTQDGKAVIIVTHDQRLKKYADEIIYVEEGKVSYSIPNEKDFT